jgi:NAD(P)-dependent dehydrogenase (short-subunit alcohol dehydrogenase family)
MSISQDFLSKESKMEIENCAAIVTGGASGIGAATAKKLAHAGAKVAIFDLNIELAQKLAHEIKGIALLCDVTNEQSVTMAIQQAREQQGIARICINCAGIALSGRIVRKNIPLSLDDFRKVIEINLVGTFNVMRLAAANMTELTEIGDSQERGIIINTASIAAMDGQIGQAAYSASKGGIVSLTLPAARELAQHNIRVMTIAPGLFDTPLLAGISSAIKSSLIENIPFPKRLARPDEYAALALHIINNPMLNGEVIRLDGALRMPAK